MAKQTAVTSDEMEANDASMATKYRKFCDDEAARLSGQPREIILMKALLRHENSWGDKATTAYRFTCNIFLWSQGHRRLDKAAQAPVKKPRPLHKTPSLNPRVKPRRMPHRISKPAAMPSRTSDRAAPIPQAASPTIRMPRSGRWPDRYCKQMTTAGNNSKNINDAAAGGVQRSQEFVPGGVR